MTEQDAKTKWCPFARCAPEGWNRDADGGRECGRCIGSACMAWRWDGDKTDGGPVREEVIKPQEKFPDEPVGFRWRIGHQDKGDVGRPIGLFARIGFCGLAGKP